MDQNIPLDRASRDARGSARRRAGSVIAALAAAGIAVVAVVTPAGADEPGLSDIVLAEHTPIGDHLAVEAGASEVTAGVIEVALPADAGDPVVLSGPHGSLDIGLPFAEGSDAASEAIGDGLTGYDNENQTVTVPVVQADGQLTLTTVIEGPGAPDRFAYSLGAGAGSVIELVDDGAVVWSAEGDFVAAVAAPWAVAADGAPVETHYALEGGQLVQYVAHDATTAYPVVADPSICGNIWTGITTTTENGQPRYGLYASVCGTSIKTGLIFGGGVAGIAIGQQVMINAGWSEAVGLVGALTSKATLRQQYDCHTIYAFAKNPWNLEKWRANNAGWPGTALSHQCNW